MKKILFLEQFASISGGQRVLINTIKGLDKTKYEALVGIPKRGEFSKELESIGVKVIVLPIGNYSPGKKSFFDVIRYVLRSIILIPVSVFIILAKKVDLVYANAPRTFLWGTFAARITKTPIIWHLHSILKGAELKLVSKTSRFGISRFIVVSNAVIEPFLKIDPLIKKKVEVVYNGIDVTRFSVRGEKGSKAVLRIPEESKVVGFIGQVAKWKGIEDLVKAAGLINKTNKNVRYIIIGDVMFGGNSKYKEWLLKLASDNGIEDKIKFLGKRSDIPKLLSVIDILVIPSILPDPCPLVLLEGMSAGKAIVASAHGGVAEIINDGSNGSLYTPGDINELSSRIVELVKDKNKRQSLGAEAHKKAANELTLNRYQQNITSIVNKSLDQK